MIGLTAEQASQAALDYMKTRVGGAGGVVTIHKGGSLAHSFTTSRMAWSQVTQEKLSYGIDPGVVFSDSL